MDHMDVDPPTCLKRHASSPTSSSAGKRARKVLPDDELTTLNQTMKDWSQYWNWEQHLKVADQDQELSLMVLVTLTDQLALTSLRDTTISGLNNQQGGDILAGFSVDEKKLWEDGMLAGILTGEWIALLDHPKLRIPTAPKVPRDQEKATKDSWGHVYCGSAPAALWEHIYKHFNPESIGVQYANFFSIVQSFGMGKSRGVDELAKSHFCIPINLRDAESTGYPPGDHEVRKYLTRKGTAEEAMHRASYFLDALFQHSTDIMNRYKALGGIEEVAGRFRHDMTVNQTMTHHNEFRTLFYDEVIKKAEMLQTNRVSRRSSPSRDKRRYDFPPANSCCDLAESLKRYEEHPLIILAFDEAHTLTNREAKCKTWSNLSVLKDVLFALSKYPLFALFLSTAEEISQPTSKVAEDPSGRISRGVFDLIEPFTALGFDILANQVSLGSCTLDNVTEDPHTVSLGRPLFGSRYKAGNNHIKKSIVLFAIEKLLNADYNTQTFNDDQSFACLSRRLPIQFNSTTYLPQEVKQVEQHMRVCLKMDAACQSMETVSSSEPLLSEAAYAIMARSSFETLKSFKSLLEGFAIHKGDRGEYLALLLFTLARDMAVGPPDKFGRPISGRRYFALAPFLYGRLFSNSESPSSASALKLLHKDFPDAIMHCSHYIELHDLKSIDECLLLLMTRGAGVLCANNLVAIDTVNIFLQSGTALTTENLGLLVSRVSNDSTYTDVPDSEVFVPMNPFELRILKKGEDNPVPLIRIFFALAAKKPSLHATRHEQLPYYDAVVYDIWSAGLSPEFLNPIGDNAEIWDSILQASGGWQRIYEADTDVARQLRGSMDPSAANDDAHWSNWAIRKGKNK